MQTMKKFLQTTGTELPTIDAKNEPPKKDKPTERILTVDIKTMRAHLRNDKFNNQNILLEFFPKIHRIFDSPAGNRINRLALQCLDSSHTIQATYYGNIEPFKTGDVVRCVGRLIGQTGQFKVLNMSKIDIESDSVMVDRLIAICSFVLAKLLSATPKNPPK